MTTGHHGHCALISYQHLSALRQAEIEECAALMRPGSTVLEIGAGTGEQAKYLASQGFAVTAIDISVSNYRERRVFEVLEYDGRRIPFSDASFDVVYSSNALEHVADLDALEREIRRVLKRDGACIHIIPSTTWRFWTSIATAPNLLRFVFRASRMTLGWERDELTYGRRVARAWWRVGGRVWEMLRQPRHGERGNAATELHLFSRGWWNKHFRTHGFDVVTSRPTTLFYTGHMIMGTRLSLPTRRRLARVLGSAGNLYVLTTPTQIVAK